MRDSRRYRQPTGERIGRPETHRPIPDDREDFTPLPADLKRMMRKFSDVEKLVNAGVAEHGKTKLLVDQLVDARKADSEFRLRTILAIAALALSVVITSFGSCVQQRENIAELKAEVRNILKGQ